LGAGFSEAGWFHGKLALLILMQIMHAALARFRRHFAQDDNRHSPRFYRIVNETVTGLLVAIVILAVVKPF
jgi:putative membrane protein